MISVIIASVSDLQLKSALKNIEATIGVPYEVITFSNGEGKMGLCEIYNKGARQAKYEALCFMHEDLDIKTLNWGEEVMKIFNTQKEVGVIGVAGGAYKSRAPSGWASISHAPNTIYCNYVQSFKRSNRAPLHSHSNPKAIEVADVVCVDGMWFCTLKELVLKYPFDEQLLKGFHCYDVDYCLTIKQHYRVVVTFNVLIEHFSEGGYNEDWFNDVLKMHSKWKSKLPLSIEDYVPSVQHSLEKRSYKLLLEQLVAMGFSFKKIKSFLDNFRLEGQLEDKLYYKLIYYAFKFYLKKHKTLAGMFA